MKICFDYGHGGDDPGAVGFGIVESHSVLEIGKKTKAIMEKQGHKIIETRGGDNYVSLARRADISNNNSCDLFVSFHLNGFHSESAHGFETYHYPNSSNGQHLANHVHQTLLNTGLFKANRGVKSDDFAVLRLTNAPAILLETGFITNQYDNSIIKNNKDDLARAISEGLSNYIGEKQPPINNVKPQTTTNALDVDGYLGVKTISRLQQYLETPVDGVISSPSVMVKELQRRLNKGVL